MTLSQLVVSEMNDDDHKCWKLGKRLRAFSLLALDNRFFPFPSSFFIETLQWRCFSYMRLSRVACQENYSRVWKQTHTQSNNSQTHISRHSYRGIERNRENSRRAKVNTALASKHIYSHDEDFLARQIKWQILRMENYFHLIFSFALITDIKW